jgi:hypothetical protein
VKRILLLLALLPSLAWAAPIYSVADGSWTNPATWVGGAVVTGLQAEAVITNNVTINSAFTVSNITVAAGSLVNNAANFTITTWRGKLLVTGGVLNFNGIAKTLYYGGAAFSGSITQVFDVTGGVVTNGNIDIRTTGSVIDFSALLGSPYIVNCSFSCNQLGANTFILTNATGNLVSLGIGSSSGKPSLLISNVTLNLTGTMSIQPSTNGLIEAATITTSSTINLGNSVSNTLRNVSITMLNSALTLSGTNFLEGVSITLSNAGADMVVSGGTSVSNSTVTVRGTTAPDITLAGTVWDSLTVVGGAALNQVDAFNFGSVTNYGTWTTRSNVVTATTIYSTNTITAGATTFTVSNFTANTWAPGTSVVRLTDGGVFNSTNGATLSVVSGNVTLATNTVLSGTIYSEAPSASLNLSSGTLTVTGQSLFSGTISNGTLGASAPVTAERTQGVSGRINSIEQMGAE